MRAGVRRAIASGAVAALAGALVFAATRPSVHRVVASFLTPLPLASAPIPLGAPTTLPVEVALPGGESRELARLAAGKAAVPARGPRLAMFPSPLRQGYAPSDRIAALRRPEIIPREDARIDDMMNYWLRDGRAHAALLAAYQRSGRYRATTERILGAWKVPEALSAMIFLESGFVPTVVQTDGSAGLWSLPLDVAQAYGLTVRETYDERRGVESSTEVAGRYLADLKERFGSWALAIYAFTHGYKKSADELVETHLAKFEDLSDARPSPDTTYVFQVFALATILENPDRFGLDSAHVDPPLATSDMEVPSEAPFSVIAQAAGTSVGHIHELNPEYLGDTVPTTGAAMIIHLPREGLARAKELLTPLLYAPSGGLAQVGRVDDPDAGAHAKGDHSTPGDPRSGSSRQVPKGSAQPGYYRAREGETLDAIASRFGVARETIASDNALDVTAPLRPAQLLWIRVPDAPTPNR